MQPTIGESGFVLDGRDWQFLPVPGKLGQVLHSIEGTCRGGALNVSTLFVDCQFVASGSDWLSVASVISIVTKGFLSTSFMGMAKSGR